MNHRFIKNHWPYSNQDQDAKHQSGTSSILQSTKWWFSGHGCSLQWCNSRSRSADSGPFWLEAEAQAEAVKSDCFRFQVLYWPHFLSSNFQRKPRHSRFLISISWSLSPVHNPTPIQSSRGHHLFKVKSHIFVESLEAWKRGSGSESSWWQT